MKYIFSPVAQTGKQVCEFNPQTILEQIEESSSFASPKVFMVDGKGYEANLGVSRLQCLKRSLTCACCGIKANRCYLDLNDQVTKETGRPFYSFNFYAESGDYQTTKVHLVLMVRDHIIPVVDGGDDSLENSQTLCYNCNSLKGTLKISLDQMRQVLFPAHRAYKSSLALNRAKELTHVYRVRIIKNKNAVVNIKKALDIVKDERRIELKEKMQQRIADTEFLQVVCDQFELDAQVTGTCPSVFRPEVNHRGEN